MSTTNRRLRSEPLAVPALLIAALLGAAACGPSGGDGLGQDATVGPDGSSLPDGWVLPDGSTIRDAAVDADPDANCGATGFAVEARPPNMLILFDRSCSMRRQVYDPNAFGSNPNDTSSRWYVAREAVRTLTGNYETRVRFGLMVFPRPIMGCGDFPQLNVTPDLMNMTDIMVYLAQSDVQPWTHCPTPPAPYDYIGGSGAQPTVTPTAEALQAIASLSELQDTARDNYVLLITDGYATCSATASSLASLAQSLLNLGIRTAVVGFGDVETAEAISMLNAIGQAGGLPAPDPSRDYWLATNPTELQTALDTIVGASVSCTFALQGTPPAEDRLYAFMDGVQLTRDDPNGWSYDVANNTVTFHGDACARIQTGQTQGINVVFGCPEDVCTPTTEVCDGIDNDCNGLVDETGCVQ